MTALRLAYMPLVDAAPVIIAQEMGFAAAEGLRLELRAAPSWSQVRDLLAFGRVDAAHLLSPVPVAMAMGLGGVTEPICAVSVLSVNGNTVGIHRDLAERMRDQGFAFGCDDPAAAAEALARVAPRLTIGVPFPFSMHALMLRDWAAATGLRDCAIDILTVPPPRMAAALAARQIDGFCVGEPWGSVAVDAGVGALLLPGRAIEPGAPEKLLCLRTAWAEAHPGVVGALVRAVHRASAWLARPDSQTAAVQVLARSAYLDLPAEIIDRALTGHMSVTPWGDQRRVGGLVGFQSGRPDPALAQGIARRLHALHGGRVDGAEAVFRADLYDGALAPTEDPQTAADLAIRNGN